MHYITLHYITSHYITSHHITSHHITSHHITSHHITSHHITLHYITYIYIYIYIYTYTWNDSTICYLLPALIRFVRTNGLSVIQTWAYRPQTWAYRPQTWPTGHKYGPTGHKHYYIQCQAVLIDSFEKLILGRSALQVLPIVITPVLAVHVCISVIFSFA